MKLKYPNLARNTHWITTNEKWKKRGKNQPPKSKKCSRNGED